MFWSQIKRKVNSSLNLQYMKENQEKYYQENSTQRQTNSKQNKLSQFYQTYLAYIGQSLTEQETQQLHNLLKTNNVIVDPAHFCQSLIYEIIETDLQSFSLLLVYGIYKMRINVLMTQFSDSFFNIQVLSRGSFSNIYLIRKNEKYYAIKRIMFQSKYYYSELLDLYKQYFLCSIASILKVGPKVQNIFGYDIVVTQNSAFFAMELCQIYTKIQGKEINKQSIENLRVLHSLKFIHLDIKPMNLAYSVSYQRYVFIDFGLSLLIKNEVGYKTFINFASTLSYCSEEMKKNYFLQKPNLIDFYYNDSISLKNTLDRIINVSDKHSQENISSAIFFESQNPESNIIQQSVYILQLKYSIFSNNLDKILELFPKIINMPKSFFAILNNKTTKRLLEKNQKVKTNLSQIKKLTAQIKNEGNFADKIISEALEIINQNQGVYNFKLSQQILNLPTQNFELLFQNQRFICNFILYLDDFSKQDTKNKEREAKVFKIIKKVSAFSKKLLVEIYEQVGYFLTYLNQKLIKKRSFKVLNIMRMLFIKIEDFKSIEPLEDQIVKMAATPTIKCLKIIQFLLFWSILFDTLKYYKINQWKKTIEELQSEEPLFTKIKQFSLTLLEIINKRFYDTGFVQNLLKIMNIEDVSSIEYKEQITVIEVLYLQFYRMQNKKQINYKTLNIYSTYFYSLKFLKTTEQVSSFDNLFSSCRKNLQKHKFFRNLQKDKQKIENGIKYIFQKFQGRPDLINERTFHIFHQNIEEKRLIFLFFNYYVENFEILCQNFEYFCQFQMYSLQKNILCLFLFIKINKFYSIKQKNQSLNHQELHIIMQKIHRVIILCDQKLTLIIEKKNFSKINSYTVFQKLMRIKFEIFNNQVLKNEKTNIQYEIQNIFEFINIQNYNYHEDLMLIEFCQILQQLVIILPQYRKKPIQDLILKISQRQIELQNFFLFQKQIFFSYHYIRINFHRNLYEKNKSFLWKISNFIQADNIKNVKYFSENSLAFICYAFCLFACPYQLQLIYQQISFKKEQFQRKFYPFYVLFIFKELYPKWHYEKEAIISQIKRSCLCIKHMFNLHALKTKKIVLSYCRLPTIIRSERKRLICERMEMRNLYEDDFISWDALLIKSLVKKIGNDKIKQYLFKQTILKKNYVSILKKQRCLTQRQKCVGSLQ